MRSSSSRQRESQWHDFLELTVEEIEEVELESDGDGRRLPGGKQIWVVERPAHCLRIIEQEDPIEVSETRQNIFGRAQDAE